MPPKSEEQKKFFQLVLAYKKGDVSKDEVSQDVIDTAEDMSTEEIKKFANEPVQEVTETELRKIVRDVLQQESVVGARHQGVPTGRHQLEPKNAHYQIIHELEDSGKEVGDGRFRYKGYFWIAKPTGGIRAYEPSEWEREGETAIPLVYAVVNDRLQLQLIDERNGNRTSEEFRTGKSALRSIVDFLEKRSVNESYTKQLANYGVAEDQFDKLYRELEERGLKIVDDGRFTYVRKGDAGARIVELEQDGKRTVKGLFTSNNDKMRGTKSSRHSFDGITIEALATKIASSLRAQQKYS